MTHYDLTAASQMFGKLIDPETHRLIKRARESGIDLTPDQIEIKNGFRLIDGMDGDDWLTHQGA